MKKEESRFTYSMVSRYRTVLMGIAIIFILFCHLDTAHRSNGLEIPPLAKVLNTFTCGVDIFMFLSGYGLYYSYTNKKPLYFEFEKKRLSRVLPLYFVIASITYVILDIIIRHLSISKLFKDLLFISWFTDGSTKYWFVLGISIFYLLFPILYKFINRVNIYIVLLFSLIWFLILEAGCQMNYHVDDLKLALARLPVFMIGILCGRFSYQNKRIHAYHVIAFMLSGYIAFIVFKRVIPGTLRSITYYPVRGMLGISVIITVIGIFEFLEDYSPGMKNRLIKCLSWFGGLTLELYLFHVSYLNLFSFPYILSKYIFTAVLLPIVSAFLVFVCRHISHTNLSNTHVTKEQ